MTERQTALLIGFGSWLLLLGCFQIYSFGFGGDFMFDDFPNLEPLGHWGVVDSYEKLLNYLGSGFSGPTGRPVALASFLIDSNTWPAEPYSFKRTNVLLHLLTGCGVLLFLIRFVSLARPEARSSGRILLASLCVVALWLLHPYWVSTTLYVIQRMAILSAMFAIFSLWCYLNARYEVARYERLNGKAVIWMFLAGMLFVLGVYSKENIIILPVCVLVLELSLQCQAPLKSTAWRWIMAIGCVLPSALLLGYLIYRGINGWDVVDGRRGFSVGDRMLAEGRVLWIYLSHIFIPQPYTGGLYTQVVAFGDWFGRFLGVLGWSAFIFLMVGAWTLRRRWPLLFPGITLYVVGHLIESTVIPLELYFEHRNYFPGIFLTFIPLQLAFSNGVPRALIWILSLTALLVFAALLWMRVSLWADYRSLVEVWADQSPGSVRAQLETSKFALQSGDLTKALVYFDNASVAAPADLRTKLWGVFVGCALEGEISEKYAAELTHHLSSAPDSGGILQYLTVLVEQVSAFGCHRVTHQRVEEWLHAYRSSARTKSKTDRRVEMLLGVNAVNAGLPGQALQYFREGVWGLRSVNSGILAVSHLATESYLDEASELLEEVSDSYEAGELVGDDVDYTREINNLRQTLSND
ncbi:hypothetical protein FDP08_05985 [Marinobacter panjinensis]|uniref:Tetratricopeptide repeat protein n=1 Tax=Marinobacter panjinensis TaxID=2576384 RepID=A0A4U6R463_9GAMM|nr:hypothetical protein [Marinobacter panjinensis]MCR8913681.1 hypothetical protein [Marinobacter panjinensis]TKV67668.1 hypothetical protein FDP08_05985 [Marinobacter panjinensis]